MYVALSPHIKNPENIRMIQATQNFRLEFKSTESVVVGGKGRGQDFNGNTTEQAGVAGLINLAHTTRT